MATSDMFSAFNHRLTALNAVDIQVYRICDDLSGILILAMVIFTPWAFGTTQPWSIWTMNIGGFALGALLLAKLLIREVKGYPAPRWQSASTHSKRRFLSERFLTQALAVLTLAVLAYCLIGALNAAAVYNEDTRLFEYQPHIAWLPHSFDGYRTWSFFWMYVAQAASFWAVWDWLLGMVIGEDRVAHDSAGDSSNRSSGPPARLRRLLWVLCINGALVGLEAIIQRAAGSDKLLFLVQPIVHFTGDTQFGPYAYRSNAAQFFDLLWPLCLGFWWMLHQARHLRAGHHHWLLVCTAIMAADPIISTSRAGALIAVGLFIVAIIVLLLAVFSGHAASSERRLKTAAILLLCFAAAGTAGWYFGWSLLAPRLEEISEGFQSREALYAAAWPMARDYPLFGVGPGTFGTVFQLYLVTFSTYWPEQLHNDWLEILITFGSIGMLLLLAALGCVLLRRFASGGIHGNRTFMTLAALGLAGCLVYAREDYPFRVYSVVFVFLVICAMLFAMGRKSGTKRR